MRWCVKGRRGGLWDNHTFRTRTQAITYALKTYAGDDVVRAAPSRDVAWRCLKARGMSVVRVEVIETSYGDADRLALAVLRGDHGATLALADLILETYHGVKQGG